MAKILLHGLNFDPEPTGIGKYSGEMVAALAAMGHEVRVVTAPPYYPAWQVYDGWRNRYSTEQWMGARVWRTPLWVPAKPTGAKRVLHLLSYSLGAVPVLLAQAFWRADVVMVVVPAFGCTPWALLLAKLSGAKAWLHVQDYEIDAAFQLGMLKNETGRRVITAMERWLMRRFDRVSSITQPMLGRARSKGVLPSRLTLLPNWVDTEAIKPLSGPSPMRVELGIPAEAKVALFSGTLGGKQGLELLPQAARLLAHRTDLYWVVCGDGVMKPALTEGFAGLPNVRMLPLQPVERLGELLGMADIHLLPQQAGMADIHLLPQQAGAADVVMPSKLGGMLASGRPVVTTANQGTELARVVSQCGRVVEPDNAEALAQAVCELADDSALRAGLGEAARLYAEQNLSKKAVVEALHQQLMAACKLPYSRGVRLDGAAENPQTTAE